MLDSLPDGGGVLSGLARIQPKDRASVAQTDYSRPARSNRSVHRAWDYAGKQASPKPSQKKASTRLAKVILEAM